MKNKTFKRVTFLFAILYFTVGYLLISYFNNARSRYFDVGFAFEKEIPLIAPFIFGYLLVYLSIAGLYFLIKDAPLFKRIVVAFLLLTTLHYMFFIFVPVKMALRPEVVNPTGFSMLFVQFYFWLDAPYNCFPSLHVAYTLLGVFPLWNYRRVWAWIYLVSTIIVAVSVVLVKQHYILDVATGFITPFFVWWISGCLFERQRSKND